MRHTWVLCLALLLLAAPAWGQVQEPEPELEPKPELSPICTGDETIQIGQQLYTCTKGDTWTIEVQALDAATKAVGWEIAEKEMNLQ